MFELTSPDFTKNTNIPKRFTCQGENAAPTLHIHNPPEGTKSFALVMDDPDAPKGNWLHWIVWNIPSTTKILDPNDFPSEATQGINDFKEFGYGGPCPPKTRHQYRFFLYALDKKTYLDKQASRAELEVAMGGHIIASCELNGYYERS